MKPFEIPTADQFRDLRVWLLNKGMSPGVIATTIGTAPNGRAIGTIAGLLRSRLKILPKKLA